MKKNTGAMKQWVKPTIDVAKMDAAEMLPKSGIADGFGATGVGPYYS